MGTTGIVCAVRTHGEHGVIARLMTPDHGLVAGYVRGGRSRAMRPVLMPGNLVTATLRSRVPGQLRSLSVELVRSRAPLLSEALAALAIEWCCSLTAFALPEEQPYPAIYQTLDAVLSAIEAGDIVRDWAGALAAYEMLLLQSLGFGSGVPQIPRDWPETFAALNLSGAQLGRHIFQGRAGEILAARSRLLERLNRAVA